MTNTAADHSIQLGVAYYPEQDAEHEWKTDARLMRELGLDCARIGEFCWNRMQAADGTFTLDWLERCIATLHGHGIRTILCTPTATPPVWLCERHPDIHPLQPNGRRALFGGRRHGSLFHPAFQEHSRAIAGALARRFGPNPAVAGWQLDNEVGSYSTLDCSEHALLAFHDWLEREYGDVAALNRDWGLIFWNQEVSRFDQIPAPTEMPCTRSPQHILAYNRFCHEGMARFLLDQARAIRPHARPGQFLVASALHPVLHQLFRLQREAGEQPVDSVTVHSYPELMPEPGQTAMHLDLMRALDSGKPFRVLEHQIGSGYSTTGGQAPAFRRCWSLETLAHGAQTLLWFHWRRFRTGCEWRLTPILERDRKPREVYHDLAELIRDIRKLEPLLAGGRPECGVQILSSYLNMIARDRASEPVFWMEIQLPDAAHERVPLWSRETRRAAYNPFHRLDRAPAFVREDEPWDPALPLIATDLDICPDPLLRKIEDWCRAGGTFICFPGAGERDGHGAHLDAPPPGRLAPLFGVELAHFYPLEVTAGSAFDHMAGQAQAAGASPESAEAAVRFGTTVIPFDVRHGEVLHVLAPDVTVLGVYADGRYQGRPAVTSRPIGRGRAVYLGAVPRNEAAAAALYRLLIPGLPARDQAIRRIRWTTPRGRFAFLINDQPDPAMLDTPVYDLLASREIRALPPFSVAVHPLDSTNPDPIRSDS